MKDSQQQAGENDTQIKYIKANNERFSTLHWLPLRLGVSISRRIMKDSQQMSSRVRFSFKYIKANNERFSTVQETGGFSQ